MNQYFTGPLTHMTEFIATANIHWENRSNHQERKQLETLMNSKQLDMELEPCGKKNIDWNSLSLDDQ